MLYRELGRTGLTVSSLCFGALTVGPLQANLPLREGAAVIRAALDAGVSFIDTAELYGTYRQIRLAVQGRRSSVVLTTKSYAYTYDGMQESIRNALAELSTDYLDIVLLHEQESRLTLAGHRDALRCIVDARQAGIVRAAGVSTHAVEVVEAAVQMPEIDVIHPIFNMRGIGIRDGDASSMGRAIAAAEAAGKGVYAMKALGGGHLIPQATEALAWVLAQPGVSSVAVGMQSAVEVAVNAALCANGPVDQELARRLATRPRRLIVDDGCMGCGRCVAACRQGSLSTENGSVRVDPANCILCGYCAAVCPQFCLKVI